MKESKDGDKIRRVEDKDQEKRDSKVIGTFLLSEADTMQETLDDEEGDASLQGAFE